MTRDVQAAILRACGRYVRKMLEPIEKKLSDLETAGIKYCGTWQRAMDYERGAVVTHKGSAWIALAPGTTGEPGDGTDWQLMVKRGRDAA